MIHQLTVEGLENPEFLKLAKEFWEEGNLPGRFTLEAFVHSWKNLISSNMGILWVCIKEDKVKGALGAILYPDINSGDLVATEAFWFMAQDARGGLDAVRMVEVFESWAKEVEAVRISMAHLHEIMPDRIAEFYEKRGYKKVETIYLKEL